ncbi:thiazole biosynthesis protein ThiJ [Bacterioplanes sanyensis]|uniref:DJ-1 family glyoxalase III n=1 Tax=Bacterioplanes sanyensis TaxID=1249553 RepID=UPI00167A136F|nr:DJ-1 family glyoxalase III [Bacterioplanes sanyensis]GGY46738.1 thiazole biosynthesis protein ThiJ [Bacterioplanes sanyensis]
MAKVVVFIADGSEEIETLTCIDVLRRAGIDTTVAAASSQTQITAAHGVRVQADCVAADCQQQQWDAVVLPGGMPGAENLNKHPAVKDIVMRQHEREGWIAAICASPAVVLADYQLLNGRRATCYPGFEEKLLESATMCVTEPIIVDGHFITSRGPATAMVFALRVVAAVAGDEKAHGIAKDLLLVS